MKKRCIKSIVEPTLFDIESKYTKEKWKDFFSETEEAAVEVKEIPDEDILKILKKESNAQELVERLYENERKETPTNDEKEIVTDEDSWDMEVNLPDQKIVENVNRNFYVRFLQYPEKKAAVWRPEEVCSGDKLNEMSLSQRGEIITNMIAKDFCDWLRGLGGVEETSMDEDILKELFQIGLENPAARSICVQMRERPVVSHHLAEAVQIPERAFQKGLQRQIEWDIEAEKKGVRKWAFGRRLLPSQQWYPPRNHTTSMWFDTKTINDNLTTFSLLFKSITELRSVKEYCKWLEKNPQFEKPDYLLEKGLFRRLSEESNEESAISVPSMTQ
ncbi:uncharacterized protein LOC111055636 [Nilaparvata lugens]|uniref:uncharacterized protein LOC111055636 n=1 Tax=Nilaparvata lugens TaxID=108931 RepID=UPI00193E230E|nr:uncharacterized protein LOC111055636 [Nilaparvata lugens]